MRRKGIFILIIVGVLLVIFSISNVIADLNTNTNLTKFKKMDGLKIIEQGVLVDLPTNKDKQELVDSINPQTGLPAIQLKPKAGEKEIFTKKLVTEDTKKIINAPYVKDQNKEIIIYDPVTTMLSIPLPTSNEYLIEFDGTIYITDWKNNKLKKFLKDEVGEYKKDQVLSTHIEQVGVPLWGAHPNLSPNSNYLIFYSERNMINGKLMGELWVKNMKTGDEYLLPEIGVIIGWVNDQTLILSGRSIFSINVQTGETKKLIENGAYINIAIINDQIVYQEEKGSITIRSIFTEGKRIVSSPLVNSIGSIDSQGSWVAFMNLIHDFQSEYSIVLYNIDNNTWKLITSPKEIAMQGFSWIDDSTLLIQTISTDGKMEESTYIVNVDELEVSQ